MKAERPILFFDADGTLIDTDDLVIEYLSWRYKVTIPSGTYICGNNLEVFVNGLLPANRQVEREKFYDDYGQNFLTSRDWHSRVLPIKGVQECLPRLAERYDLYGRHHAEVDIINRFSDWETMTDKLLRR
jgi:FMN phosphatase YigB (HAD superfamily)